MEFFDLYLAEWGNLFLRWLHIIAAMAWIGSSFFFMHLDASLKKDPEIEKGGAAWQVHGGGFYQMKKYMVAPAVMPEHLTWHKWQSYWTWISGFFLLCWMYYAQASLYLVDPSVMKLTGVQASLAGLSGLVIGWLVYDGLCKSPLGKHEAALAIVGFLYVVMTSYVFSKLFSPRGALIHTGAVMATMMTANVFIRIIPNTRKSVAALTRGEATDPAWGKEAKQRSTHNNYITLPVVFMMITNHYPLTTASSDFIPVLTALVLLAGGLIRHFYNVWHAEKPPIWWAIGLAVLALGFAAFLSVKYAPVNKQMASLEKPPVAVADIILSRCSMCHMSEPVYEGIKMPPKGVLLDSDHAILQQKEAIKLHSVVTHNMPPNNITELTKDERRVLAEWVKTR
jgi:uncharacterized membrane protein